MFKITDWTGKDVYPGKAFDTEQDAWDFLVADQHARNPNADDHEFEEIMGEFGTKPIPVAPKRKTLRELGQIMLDQAGPEACQKGYGTTDPEWVGRCARQYNDINPDGTLN